MGLILGCLYKQLVAQNSQVLRYAGGLWERSSHPQEPLRASTLETALRIAVSHFDRVFFILDSLDHCNEEKVRRPLLIFLKRLQEAGASILVTSRPHPADIHYRLGEWVKFEVHAGEEDIKAYIDDYLWSNPLAQQLCGGRKKDKVVRRLIESSNGM